MRHPDWEARLVQIVKTGTDRPFEPRYWNCALFAKACAEAVSGQEILWKWKGSVEATADSVLERIQPSQACRGDVVLATLPEPSLGVCLGALAAFVAHQGLYTVPMSRVTAAWAV